MCFAFVDSRVLILKLDVFAQKIQEVIQQLESWLSTSIFKCTLLFDYHQAFWEIIYQSSLPGMVCEGFLVRVERQ